jgi:hypothetical protein
MSTNCDEMGVQVISGWDKGILGTDGIPPMLAGSLVCAQLKP